MKDKFNPFLVCGPKPKTLKLDRLRMKLNQEDPWNQLLKTVGIPKNFLDKKTIEVFEWNNNGFIGYKGKDGLLKQTKQK